LEQRVITSGVVARSAFFFFLVFGITLAAVPPVRQFPSQHDLLKSEEKRLYSDAHPYLDEPLATLKKIVPELKGLEPAPSQEHLSELLAKIGAMVEELLQKVPDLISEEVVTQRELTKSDMATEIAPNSVVPFDNKSFGSEKNLNYIILRHTRQNQRPVLEEYRSDSNGKPVTQGAESVRFQGFVANWVIFSSSNHDESRFRDLGEQRMDGHNTFVVAFAQIPGSVESPGRIVSGSRSTLSLLQGIAWVDQSDFRIVHLRTDILAPRPEVPLQRLTAKIQFGPVHLAAETNLELWLPLAVEIDMEASGRSYFEQHKYSRYRLYQVKTRILSPTP
jgi:hypothetical protein